MSPPDIVPLGAEHLAAMAKLMRAAILTHGRRSYDAHHCASWAHGVDRDLLHRGLSAGEQFFGACTDTRIVGFTSVTRDKLVGLYVDPDHMGEGHGRALLNAGEEALRRAGCQTARLTAAQNAVPFYRARGWHGAAPRDWKTRGGLVIPVTDMTKQMRP